jgi:hypothetical protein
VQAKHLRVTKTLSPAILRSCKQVYYEAFPILYGANYFKSDSYLGEKRWTGDFLRCIGKERAKDVRHLVIPMHEHSDRYENKAVRATSRGHFEFKLMAGLTGMHTLELEFGTWVLERPIDWIHLIDDQLRESRHSTPAIAVTVTILSCPDEIYAIPDGLLRAWKEVGWSHRAVHVRLVLVSTCCRERATCRPDCHPGMARWQRTDFVRDCGKFTYPCECGQKHHGEPIWIGRTDWNDDDPMPTMPEDVVSRHIQDCRRGLRRGGPGKCIVGFRRWPLIAG